MIPWLFATYILPWFIVYALDMIQWHGIRWMLGGWYDSSMLGFMLYHARWMLGWYDMNARWMLGFGWLS